MEADGPSALKITSGYLLLLLFVLLGIALLQVIVAIATAIVEALRSLLPRRTQPAPQQFRELLLPSGAVVGVPDR